MKKLILIFSLLALFVGCGQFDKTFEEKFGEMFIPEEIGINDCGTPDNDESLYQLNEVFFNNNEILTFNLNIIYFTNGRDTLPMSFFNKRVEDISDFYIESEADINFKLTSVQQITEAPKEDSIAMEYITKLEFVKNHGKPINDIRDYYTMNAYKFWANVYNKENHLNLYIYNDFSSSTAGIAGGIGSVFSAVRLDFLETEYRTVEHEIAHCLFLYHTHSKDGTVKGCNEMSGDKVSDTFKSPRLLGLVSDSCELHPYWKDLVKKEWYESSNSPMSLEMLQNDYPGELDKLIGNVMSYTRHTCRAEFTDGQVMRMRKSIENSSDLRSCIVGMETPYSDALWEEFESL